MGILLQQSWDTVYGDCKGFVGPYERVWRDDFEEIPISGLAASRRYSQPVPTNL